MLGFGFAGPGGVFSSLMLGWGIGRSGGDLDMDTESTSWGST